jgi:hypothetical protein
LEKSRRARTRDVDIASFSFSNTCWATTSHTNYFFKRLVRGLAKVP